jgi:hypothetical protein
MAATLLNPGLEAIVCETIDEMADASFPRPASEASFILPFASTTPTIRLVGIRTDDRHERILDMGQFGKLLGTRQCPRVAPEQWWAWPRKQMRSSKG